MFGTTVGVVPSPELMSPGERALSMLTPFHLSPPRSPTTATPPTILLPIPVGIRMAIHAVGGSCVAVNIVDSTRITTHDTLIAVGGASSHVREVGVCAEVATKKRSATSTSHGSSSNGLAPGPGSVAVTAEAETKANSQTTTPLALVRSITLGGGVDVVADVEAASSSATPTPPTTLRPGATGISLSPDLAGSSTEEGERPDPAPRGSSPLVLLPPFWDDAPPEAEPQVSPLQAGADSLHLVARAWR